MEENARLSYQAICEQYNCTGQDLLDILSREHQQTEMLQTSGLSDADIAGSEFVRVMIFEGHLVYFNENELREIHRLMNNASFNINQIARRASSTNNVYKSDLDEIKEMLNNIWQPLIYFQSQLLRLKR